MLVIAGKLVRVRGITSEGLEIPPLEYQITGCTADYNGAGTDMGSCVVVNGEKWEVSPSPTPDSLDRHAGFWARVDALRARMPKGSERFVEGWRNADEQIKALPKGAQRRLKGEAEHRAKKAET